jgi:hypothetical protein
MKASPEKPRCPFCYHEIEQPKELRERKIIEFPIGVCEHCGAVYAYDVTGHNMGAAFIEALLFACNDDDYLAFSLSCGEDYTDAVIGNYDIMTHTIVPERNYNERYIRGALIFVKLIDQFREANEEKVKERLKASLPITKAKLRSEKFSKEIVHQYALENKLDELIALAEEDSRVINELQRMLYTSDELLRWRIIDMFSAVSRKVGESRPDLISKLLSNLLQNAAYPGASAWGSLEAAGAIISMNPDLFGEFSPALLSFLHQKNLWKEVTWAIGKIASVKPDTVKYSFRALRSLLENPDPAIRGHAVWALGNIGFNDVIEELKKLETDENKLLIWRDGELQEVTVAQLAKEAQEKINTCRSQP